MKKIVESVKTIAIILLLAVGCFYGYKFYNIKNMAFQKGEKSFDSEIIEERIKEVSELVTLEYGYTMSEKSEEDYIKFFKWDVPFTDKYMIVQYDGMIKYSTDLSKANVDVQDTKATVTLEHSQISSHEIDEDSWKFLDQKSGLFNSLKPEDDAEIRKEAKANMEKRAKELNLQDTADKNAENQLKLLLQAVYPGLEVEVVFK